MRLGIAYFLNSFAYLTGPPVSGALLGSQNRWVRPIIFSAVCPIRSLQGRCHQGYLLSITKVVLLAGEVPSLLIARMLQAKRKGTRYVWTKLVTCTIHHANISNKPCYSVSFAAPSLSLSPISQPNAFMSAWISTSWIYMGGCVITATISASTSNHVPVIPGMMPLKVPS